MNGGSPQRATLKAECDASPFHLTPNRSLSPPRANTAYGCITPVAPNCVTLPALSLALPIEANGPRPRQYRIMERQMTEKETSRGTGPLRREVLALGLGASVATVIPNIAMAAATQKTTERKQDRGFVKTKDGARNLLQGLGPRSADRVPSRMAAEQRRLGCPDDDSS